MRPRLTSLPASHHLLKIESVRALIGSVSFLLLVLASVAPARAQEAGALLLPEANAGTVVDIASGGDFAVAPRFATGLSFPTAICQGPGGDVYVAEAGSGEITIITGGGNFAGAPAFATGLQTPTGLHCTPDLILVTENTGSRVLDITAGGPAASAPIVATLNQPADLLLDSGSRLLASNFSAGVFDITGGGNGVLLATDDLPPSPASIPLAQLGSRLLVGHWRADVVVDVTEGGAYSENPVFASVTDPNGGGPIGLFVRDDGAGAGNDQLLVATWELGASNGYVYDITSGEPVLYAWNVAPYDVAEMAFIGEVCGNGVIEGAEECDDGNDVDTDACTNDCTAAFCGDGIVWEDVEECDDGNGVSTDACLPTCVPNVCGDGVLHFGVEECDDGNDINTDGCLINCQLATCGDDVVQEEVEECDDGNDVNTDACLVGCFAAVCGDGFVHAGQEECDDGNDNDADHCRNDCTLPHCGNGITDPLEQCDDGNRSNGDDCLNSCVRARCGDGFVHDEDEECDDGNRDDSDHCTNRCLISFCGDGVLRFDEECDDGDDDDNDGCLTTCRVAYCGDGVLQYGVESCDDGNNEEGDGCDALCQKEFDVVSCRTSGAGERGGERGWLLGLFAVLLFWSVGRGRRR